jgi:eukaryotic-like serine/threonine-protein kinase
VALTAGMKLGPYEVTAPLGAGGMGEVYRASDPRLRREVAIKVMPPGLAADPARLRRFEQEALAAASLNHANILAVYDIGVHDAAPYIVSELLEGSTLREVLSDGALPARKALDYGVQIANGLAAAHDKGIVHRDLKPENVFVTRDGRVKILDFGLAKLTQAEPTIANASNLLTAVADTEPGMIVGTVGYMSPEQVRGAAADHRSDIFAFAVILYEMISGRRAFEGPSAIETMNAILKEDPSDFRQTDRVVPPALERIIRRCLEKNPEQRFQSARDLSFNLEAVSSDSGQRVAASGIGERPTRRHFSPAWIAVPLLVAALVGGGYWAARVFATSPQPVFKRLTFRRGAVQSARFAPDGQTIVYSAAWQGNPLELFSTRLDSIEARSLGAPGAAVLSVSATGEMALRLQNGNLARAPLAGGAPREVVERVINAAWTRDGQTLALVRNVNGRRRIEFPPGKVLYETAGSIYGLALSHDGRLIAFAESPPGIGPLFSVSVVDPNGAHRSVSDGWRSVDGVTWSPRGDEIWFVASRSKSGAGELFGVTPTGRLRDILRAPANLEIYDALPDGKVLLGRSDLRFEARGLLQGDTGERDLSWFDSTGLSDLSSDGRTLVITEDGEVGLRAYLRKAEDSSAVPLGDVGVFAVSPDGRSALFQSLAPLRFGILPIGPGEAREIPHPGFDGYSWANWFPEGKQILFAGSETGHGLRLYVEDLDGGHRRAIAPEGATIPTGSHAVSPDGTLVAALSPSRQVMLYPVNGDTPRPVPGLSPGELPTQWTADSRFLYVLRHTELPARVFRVELATGRRELWKELGPADRAGVTGLGHVLITPDGRSYTYNFRRALSDLYLVEGLK